MASTANAVTAETQHSYGKSPRFQRFFLPSLTIPFRRSRHSHGISTSSSHTANSLSTSGSSHGTSSYINHDDSGSTQTSPASSTTTLSPIAANHFTSLASKPITTTTRLTRIAPEVLRCRSCSADVAFTAQIVSKGFTGRHGRAFLVAPAPPHGSPTPTCPAGVPSGPLSASASFSGTEASLPNVRIGRSEDRQLATGLHTVADIHCVACSARLGWKYIDAVDEAQRYKIGRYILETARVIKSRNWEDVEVEKSPSSKSGGKLRVSKETARRAGLASFGAYLYDVAAKRRRSSVDVNEKLAERKESTSSADCFADIEATGPHLVDQSVNDKGLEDLDEVIFDSDDEDECDDLFAGIWDAATVARRRNSRVTVIPR